MAFLATDRLAGGDPGARLASEKAISPVGSSRFPTRPASTFRKVAARSRASVGGSKLDQVSRRTARRGDEVGGEGLVGHTLARTATADSAGEDESANACDRILTAQLTWPALRPQQC